MTPRTRTLVAGLAVAAGLASPLSTAVPAQAVVPSHVVTAAGSDTTQAVMAAVLARYAGPSGDQTANIPAVPTGSGFVVPADSTCGQRLYVVSGTPPTSYTAPNGSGAGKNALKDPTNLTNGCIDIARSSSGPGASDPAAFRYFGFAKDAVSWAAFNGGHAPASLSKAQIKSVYDCTFTNWSDLGGTAGPIQRYLPQAGSGTRSFFIANILDASDPTTVSGPSCPAVKTVEENKGDQIALADQAGAIFPYSAGQWIAQANGVIANHRSSSTVRAITIANTSANPVARPHLGKYAPNVAVVTSGTFPGVRTVYNVLDTDSVAFTAARNAVGFDAANPTTGVKSPLCSGQLASLLQAYGFTPLAADGNGITCTQAP